MVGFLPGNYEKCHGMNKDGKCKAGYLALRHMGHKKVWGVWYGQIPKDGKTPKIRQIKNENKRKKS